MPREGPGAVQIGEAPRAFPCDTRWLTLREGKPLSG
jgi:hypothetical protein